MGLLSNLVCKTILMCSDNIWQQQDFNSFFKGGNLNWNVTTLGAGWPNERKMNAAQTTMKCRWHMMLYEQSCRKIDHVRSWCATKSDELLTQRAQTYIPPTTQIYFYSAVAWPSSKLPTVLFAEYSWRRLGSRILLAKVCFIFYEKWRSILQYSSEISIANKPSFLQSLTLICRISIKVRHCPSLLSDSCGIKCF